PGTASLAASGTQQFTALLKDAAGNTLTGRTVAWSSSATSVATVGATSGLATAVTNGTSSIVATSEGRTGSAQLTVQTLSASTFSLTSSGAAHIRPGETGVAVVKAGRPCCASITITLEVASAPTGITATLDTRTYAGDTSAMHLRIAVGASVAAGTVDIVVRGTTPGQAPVLLTVPVEVTTASIVSPITDDRIAAGRNLFSCGLRADGAPYCWGLNQSETYGSCYLRIAGCISSASPAVVSGSLRLRTIASGGFFTCGIALTGEAWCWGFNDQGQLGTGDFLVHNDPV
ncbi:MAG: Ig-like domain-containing protein, partial [Gemmatimonadota bacterium]|nr:Ig-like domain-containing protein [Gemmatimonadota bacterium]